jgi:hypothetical protein
MDMTFCLWVCWNSKRYQHLGPKSPTFSFTINGCQFDHPWFQYCAQDHGWKVGINLVLEQGIAFHLSKTLIQMKRQHAILYKNSAQQNKNIENKIQ